MSQPKDTSQEDAKKIERDEVDKESLRIISLVVNGVVGDTEEGPDSEIYGGFGYTRTSARKTGLTRKKKSGNGNGGGK
jgi:hypothetical protein